VASSPALYVNAITGLLSGRPNLIGQFVVGICAKEYRNGKLINTHYRDFQFNIRACIAQVTSGMLEQTKICNGSTISFSNTSVSTSGIPKAFWNFGVPNIATDTSSLFNPSFQFPDTGKYVVTLISDPGKPCTDTIKRNFYIYPPLDIHFPKQAKQCLDSNLFQFTASGNYPSGSSFRWSFGARANPSLSLNKIPDPVTYKTGGDFAVSLFAKFGPCEDVYTDTITVIDIPDDLIANWDTTIVIGEAITLKAYGGSGYTYTWTPVIDYLDCGPCYVANPQSMALKDIVYTVLTEEPNGCFITSRNYTVWVDYKTTVDVPSAFTPNGDGTNDLIYVDGWGIKKLIYFKIFNRWGQLIFETTDIKTGWDGKYNGIPQNIETYVYQASVETYVKEEPVIYKTGSFKLIR
jgi:gliding motility-associated-like protein